MDHDRLRESLDLAVEGELSGAELAAVEAHVGQCAECRVEQERLLKLSSLLTASRVVPREGFASEVMRGLPPAAWEARTMRAWRWPFALLLALGGLAAALFGNAAAALEPQAPTFSAFFALARLAESALLAGAGLLGASWQGLGAGLALWLTASRANLVVAAVLLVAVNLLLVRLLRSPRKGIERAGRRSR